MTKKDTQQFSAMNKRNVAILGSTGSIGTQALEVIKAAPERFQVEVLTAQNNAALLIRQAQEYKPNAVVIGNEAHYEQVKEALEPLYIKVFCGESSLEEIVELDSIDIVLTAMVGFAGLKPTLRAITAGKNIAQANKETLVVAGHIITQEARKAGVNIYPVDSEHSAIFQCLVGEDLNSIEKLILTASGGPFRGENLNFLKRVTKKQALKHPNWDMGAKITIDSASLMNKGLEVIEAHWLFGIPAEDIEVVIHPQSIIHSMVQFTDGSIKAQMGLPDMKLPIQYALTFPERLKTEYPRFSFTDFPNLTFEEPDTETFRNLALAYEALNKGGNMPCILNAANEMAVAAFLREEVSFTGMSDIISKAMQSITFMREPGYDDYVMTDRETRAYVKSLKI